ncbi:MAG: SpoIIE family protein phosphatase [Bdellovibrionota bacterium]
MDISLSILTENKIAAQTYALGLKNILSKYMEVKVNVTDDVRECGGIVFVDEDVADLDSYVLKLDRRGRAVFLLVRDREDISGIHRFLLEGKVDDVLIHPFRAIEVLSRIRHCQQILMWNEVSRLNASFSEILDHLTDDLRLAERLQRGKIQSQNRFSDVNGFRIAGRYVAGMRSGGDYFDVAEAKDRSMVSVVLCDSSSYGLASAVLSVIVRAMLKLSADQSSSSVETVKRVKEELCTTLSERDHLSIFYGVMSRRDGILRYLNLGSSLVFHARENEMFEELSSSGSHITMATEIAVYDERQLKLEQGSRLVLVSDGFLEAFEERSNIIQLLNGRRNESAVETLNELVFQVKGHLAEEDDMPAQDCTAMVIDVDSKIVRFAKS